MRPLPAVLQRCYLRQCLRDRVECVDAIPCRVESVRFAPDEKDLAVEVDGRSTRARRGEPDSWDRTPAGGREIVHVDIGSCVVKHIGRIRESSADAV